MIYAGGNLILTGSFFNFVDGRCIYYLYHFIFFTHLFVFFYIFLRNKCIVSRQQLPGVAIPRDWQIPVYDGRAVCRIHDSSYYNR